MSNSWHVLIATLCVAACGRSEHSTPSDGAVPETCTMANVFCAGFAYTLCVDLQDQAGHCVDWSRIGATPCPGSPVDCPTTLPKASFPEHTASTPISICVAKDKHQYGDPDGRRDSGTPQPGYCAAFQSAVVIPNVATCSPNPCGANGHCSVVRNSAEIAVVECLWPL
jgi:hypothetical protein